jgi:hypothetical protein
MTDTMSTRAAAMSNGDSDDFHKPPAHSHPLLWPLPLLLLVLRRNTYDQMIGAFSIRTASVVQLRKLYA